MESTNQHKSVFVVEDDIELSTIIDRVLTSIDSEVCLDWSTSAEEAIKTIESAYEKSVPCPYDLIIVDMFLDGVQNGLDLWKLCRRDYPGIPVVLTSANKLESFFPENTMSTERPMFLQKPFNIPELKTLLQNLMSPSNLVSN